MPRSGNKYSNFLKRIDKQIQDFLYDPELLELQNVISLGDDILIETCQGNRNFIHLVLSSFWSQWIHLFQTRYSFLYYFVRDNEIAGLNQLIIIDSKYPNWIIDDIFSCIVKTRKNLRIIARFAFRPGGILEEDLSYIDERLELRRSFRVIEEWKGNAHALSSLSSE